MAFADDMTRFALKLHTKVPAVFNGVADEVFKSAVEGSAITGAPGQPVDTGTLKASWQNLPVTPFVRDIVTKVEYAPIIEFNIRGATLRSAVGGFHSVAMTRAGFQRIVDHVTAEVAGG